MIELTPEEIDALRPLDVFGLKSPELVIDGRKVCYLDHSLHLNRNWAGAMLSLYEELPKGAGIYAKLADMRIWQQYVMSPRTVNVQLMWKLVDGTSMRLEYDCTILLMEMDRASDPMTHTCWSALFRILKPYPARFYRNAD